MKRILVTAFIATILSGCVVAPNQSSRLLGSAWEMTLEGNEVFSIETIPKYQGFLRSSADYRSIESQLADVRTRAASELWTDAQLKAEVESIENYGGYFYVTGYARTIGAASRGAIEVILIQDGQPVDRSLMEGYAELPSHSDYDHFGDYWWNSTIVYTKNLDMSKPFELRVVHKIGGDLDRLQFTPKLEAK